jgi:hypothetical protein
METKVFDRETLLDLVVNGVPLFILLFFVGLFLVLPAFGMDGLATGLQMGIIIGSFVALLILTYVVGKAISVAEKTGTVYMPGQANVEGSKPLEERERALERGETPAAAEPAGELAEGTDEDGSDSEDDEADADTDQTDTDRQA